ncbi:MAG: hypothetical protein KDB21_12040, partial [Acidimicrobiales bacterium]|nr:hypothetical protein [Acidimicrobiales bacterium]
MRHRRLAMMRHHLGLDDEQATAIETIVRESREQRRQRIREVLRPDQAAKFDELRSRRRRHRQG